MSGIEVVETYMERYPRARLLAALVIAQASSKRKGSAATLGEVWAAYRRLYDGGGVAGSVGWFRVMERDGLVENPRRSLWRITDAGYARAFVELVENTETVQAGREEPFRRAVEARRDFFDLLFRSFVGLEP